MTGIASEGETKTEPVSPMKEKAGDMTEEMEEKKERTETRIKETKADVEQ